MLMKYSVDHFALPIPGSAQSISVASVAGIMWPMLAALARHSAWPGASFSALPALARMVSSVHESFPQASAAAAAAGKPTNPVKAPGAKVALFKEFQLYRYQI